MDLTSHGAHSAIMEHFHQRPKLLTENSETERKDFTFSGAKPLSGKKTESEYS